MSYDVTEVAHACLHGDHCRCAFRHCKCLCHQPQVERHHEQCPWNAADPKRTRSVCGCPEGWPKSDPERVAPAPEGQVECDGFVGSPGCGWTGPYPPDMKCPTCGAGVHRYVPADPQARPTPAEPPLEDRYCGMLNAEMQETIRLRAELAALRASVSPDAGTLRGLRREAFMAGWAAYHHELDPEHECAAWLAQRLLEPNK